MRSALPDFDLNNFCPAIVAGKTCTVVNVQFVLKLSTAVNPIDAGAIGFNLRH